MHIYSHLDFRHGHIHLSTNTHTYTHTHTHTHTYTYVYIYIYNRSSQIYNYLFRKQIYWFRKKLMKLDSIKTPFYSIDCSNSYLLLHYIFWSHFDVSFKNLEPNNMFHQCSATNVSSKIIYTYIYIYIYIYIYMCVCVCACVCVYNYNYNL